MLRKRREAREAREPAPGTEREPTSQEQQHEDLRRFAASGIQSSIGEEDPVGQAIQAAALGDPTMPIEDLMEALAEEVPQRTEPPAEEAPRRYPPPPAGFVGGRDFSTITPVGGGAEEEAESALLQDL